MLDAVAPSGPAVIFDADGVLVDSHGAYRDVWYRWALLHALDAEAVLAATHGRRPVETVAEVAAHLDAEVEYARLRQYVQEIGDAFPVFPDAAALLAQLPPSRWAIVTSGDAATVRTRLRAGGLPVPCVLVDGHAVGRGKPDPEGFLLAADLLGVSAAQCLVVEDAPAGVQAARSAGMAVLALTTSHDAGDLVAADVVVTSLTEAAPHLVAWIESGTRPVTSPLTLGDLADGGGVHTGSA